MDKKPRTHEPEGNDSISEKRRKLLKSAVTTAPVIATLQSGAAFANTSAFQCINDAKTTSVDEWVGDPVPAGDNWIRTKIKRYKQGGSSSSNPWWYDVDNVGGGQGTYYRVDDNGNIVSEILDPSANTGWTDEDVNVIVYYEPNGDYTNVAPVGVYPKYYIAPPYDAQLPINGSCLASMA